MSHLSLLSLLSPLSILNPFHLSSTIMPAKLGPRKLGAKELRGLRALTMSHAITLQVPSDLQLQAWTETLNPHLLGSSVWVSPLSPPNL